MASQNTMRWNRGGWLGGQIGGSAWILLAGVLTLSKHVLTSMAVIGLFAIVNGIGWVCWRRRDRLSAHAGIQVLLLTQGICGVATVYLLDRAALFEAIQLGSTVPASTTYWLLILMVPGLMLMFYLRFGRSHKE